MPPTLIVDSRVFCDQERNERTTQRCARRDYHNLGESSGPIPVEDPWGAFAEDQLGLLDHLGIREFLVLGCCIGGLFVLKLMERAPDRVMAGVLCQSVGHRPENLDVMYNSGHDTWGPALCARRPDVTMEVVLQTWIEMEITPCRSNL